MDAEKREGATANVANNDRRARRNEGRKRRELTSIQLFSRGRAFFCD